MKFLDRFEKVPLGCGGVALGFFGITNALILLLSFIKTDVYDIGTISFNPIDFRYIPVIISGILLICLLLKNIIHWKVFHQESKHNLFSSFIPTIFMTLMLFGGWIASYNNSVAHYIGAILWYIMVILHYLFLFYFFYHILLKHDWKNDTFYSSWYVPPIGMVVSCTVFNDIYNTGLVPIELFYFIWFTGFVFLLIMSPVVIYKTIFFDNYKKEELGVLGIFAAPSSLVLSGYLNIFGNGHHYFLDQNSFYGLFLFQLVLSMATTFILYIMLFKIILHRFNPSWAALTFPFAISTTATFLSAREMYLINSPFFEYLKIVSIIKLSFSLLLISYIAIRYYILLSKIIIIGNNLKK